jgi:hypothetical protein
VIRPAPTQSGPRMRLIELDRAITPQALKTFASQARRRMRTESDGYRRDHLRALAQRVEVDAKEIRIMGSKSVLLRTLAAASSAKTAGFGVPSSVPKWRARRDSNSHQCAKMGHAEQRREAQMAGKICVTCCGTDRKMLSIQRVGPLRRFAPRNDGSDLIARAAAADAARHRGRRLACGAAAAAPNPQFQKARLGYARRCRHP